MRNLWISFIVLASLGSIYPFNFQFPEPGSEAVDAFLKSCCGMLSRGDILANVILFAPIGFTGMLSAPFDRSAKNWFIRVCVVGVVIAFALQVMQLFLPSRDENLQDVFWNFLGIAGGAAFAFLARSANPSPFRQDASGMSLVPLTLLATWLCYRLIPFVPSLDLQLFKDSLKPLLNLNLDPISVMQDVTAWLCIGYFLRHLRQGSRLDDWLPMLMVAVFCLEVIIVDNSIDLSDIVGAFLAALLWFGVLRHIREPERVLVVLLLGTLVLAGLAPFDYRPYAVSFNWLPFHGFLKGSMYINAQSAAEKVFLYGGLVYFLWKTKLNVTGGILVSVAFVTMIELSQMRFAGHTPEITDPMLVILAALALLSLERHEQVSTAVERRGRVPQIDGSNANVNLDSSVEIHSNQWVEQSVHLRGYQIDFLSRLSQESGVSVSNVTRQIIARFIDDLESENSAQPTRKPAAADYNSGQQRWVNQTVNLRKSQYDFLKRLSREMGGSVSRVSRRIVDHFIRELDGIEQT